MKEYDIVIEGEHISFESRHLRFGELQKVDNCADLYKEGQYVDNGFASEVISDLRPEAPVCMRIAVRDCAAWGEFDDEKFDPEQLKIIKAQKTGVMAKRENALSALNIAITR